MLAWRERDDLGDEQALRRDAPPLVVRAEALERHALGGRVLVEDVHPVRPLGEEEHAAHLPDEVELAVEVAATEERVGRPLGDHRRENAGDEIRSQPGSRGRRELPRIRRAHSRCNVGVARLHRLGERRRNRDALHSRLPPAVRVRERRERERVRQGRVELARHRVEDAARVGEAHLRLLRVHVDVDHLRRQRDVHDPDRVPPRLEDRPVRLRHGARQLPVLHRATVHEDVQRDGAGARTLGRREVRLDVHRATLTLAGLEALLRDDLTHPLEARSGPRDLARDLAVAAEREAHARGREGREHEHLSHVSALGRRGLEELAARRDVEEEVAHLDVGADGAPRRAHLGVTAADDDDLRPRVVAPQPGREREARDGRDARERLPSEAERGDAREVGQRRYLAGRVALEREARVDLVHPGAVVGHADARDAAGLDLYTNLRGPRVERVLDELLHDAGGSLDDLAGCDLVGEVVREAPDDGHGRTL